LCYRFLFGTAPNSDVGVLAHRTAFSHFVRLSFSTKPDKAMKTDLQIQNDVMAELSWDASVQARQIGVGIKDGIVILNGEVESLAEKLSAERAALRVEGVRALVVELDVHLPGSTQKPDLEIARTVEQVLNWSAQRALHDLMVVVEKGWVTLSGCVTWNYQRRLASTMVRSLMGVRGVTDLIELKPLLCLSDVKTQIDSALKRHVLLNNCKIDIAADEDAVVIKGQVHSLAEHSMVLHSVWSTPGVRTIVDQMEIL
jgi:osmotically-inducible protein OsmY